MEFINFSQYKLLKKNLSPEEKEYKTYLESVAEPYLKHLLWEEKDGKKLKQELSFFWSAVYGCGKSPAKIKELLEWVKVKDEAGTPVYPNGISNLLNK